MRARNRDNQQVHISPEFTFNQRGETTRIGHKYNIRRNLNPRPQFSTLREAPQPTEIIEIIYVDPTHRWRTRSIAEIHEFQPSVLWFLGYLVEEDDSCFKLAISKFEYVDGSIDYETPHIILKGANQIISYYET